MMKIGSLRERSKALRSERRDVKRGGSRIRLVQFCDTNGLRRVAAAVTDGFRIVVDAGSIYQIATAAIRDGLRIEDVVQSLGVGPPADVMAAYADGRLLPPLDHPDPRRTWLTGTGLTHLGSADARDQMHDNSNVKGILTDTIRMFRLGLEGGKPIAGTVGAQPEWFYKGNGTCMVASGTPIRSPSFALDHGDEAELAALYIVGPTGEPFRLGFSLANDSQTTLPSEKIICG